MKRGFIFAILPLIAILFIGFGSAICNLDASLINQDPYPAVPGDYVKLVFQLTGVEDSACANIEFELKEQYPISFDPSENPIVKINSGTYTKDYQSFLMIPYKVRIDKEALEGDTPIEVVYKNGDSSFSKQFNIYIKDVRADFEVHLKDYNFDTNTITLEILNIGESDAEALTIEIPPQKTVEIKGPNKNIVGSLDSNDYITADFEATLNNGKIEMNIYYTDTTGVRRLQNEIMEYDFSQFEDRKKYEKSSNVGKYLSIIIIIFLIGYFIYRRIRKKKK